MVPDNICTALEIFYNKVKDKDIIWVLSGSTSLVIQGVDVKVNDIDILTDEDGAIELDKILKEFCVKKTVYSTTEKYRSYLGIYMIGDVKLETMGNFQYKMKNGRWSLENHKNKVVIKRFNDMNLPLLKLEQEYEEYYNLGDNDKSEKIRKFLNKCKYL